MVEKDVIVGRFVFDTSGVGGSGKYSKSSSGGSTGAVAGGMAVWDIIKGTLVKIFDIMKKSSGQLQGSLKIINTSLILFLRPIADVIGMILRPFALMMLKYGLQFYKWWNSNSTKFQNFLNVIGKPLGNIADLFKTIFSIPTNPVDIIFNPIVDQIAKTVAVDVARIFHVKSVRKFQLVLTGRNLITVTKYTGMDPEINSGPSNSSFDRGMDCMTMPNLRTYQAGINIGF